MKNKGIGSDSECSTDRKQKSRKKKRTSSPSIGRQRKRTKGSRDVSTADKAGDVAELPGPSVAVKPAEAVQPAEAVGVAKVPTFEEPAVEPVQENPDPSISERKLKFDAALHESYKNFQCPLFTIEKYNAAISTITRFKEQQALYPDYGRGKIVSLLQVSKIEYNYIRKYDTVTIGNKQYLQLNNLKETADKSLFPNDSAVLAHFDEVFDVIQKSHNEVGHAAIRLTWIQVKKYRSNISRAVCEIFVSMCPTCIGKGQIPKRQRGK